MKRILPVLLLVSTFFLTAGIAEAHTIETNGSVRGVMHIWPAHKPTATETAHFEFFMSSTKGAKFDAAAYAYTLQVSGEGMATSTAPVLVHGSTLQADYKFPHEGQYAAQLTGSSTVSSQPNFVLDFDDITVLPAGQHENPIENLMSDHLAHVLLVVLIIGAFLAVVAWDKFVVRRRGRFSRTKIHN